VALGTDPRKTALGKEKGMPRIKVTLVVLAGLAWVGCDGTKEPLDPAIQAAGAAGPKVTAPSNTNALAASQISVDVSWRDNSSNESGFEVHRSTAGASGAFTLRAATGAGVMSYSDTGLTTSTQYCYKVRGFKTADGKTSYSGFSNTACATTPTPPPPPPPPGAPFATNATPRNSSTIDVTWIENSSRDGFRIDRSLDLGATWTAADRVSANAYSFSDTGRTAEQQVCYRVVAFNRGGDSPPSNTDCTTAPAAPAGFTATGVDGPTIDLAWTDNTAVEDGYEMQRSTDGVTFSHLSDLSANNTSSHDGSVTSNTTYWYRVRAKKDGGFSDFSNIASGTSGSLVPPAAPGLSADHLQYGSSNILLLWWAGSYNQDGFMVERCLGVICGDTDFTMIATLSATSSYYFDTDVQPGSTYAYRVRAFNRAGDSASSQISATACVVFIDSDGFYGCS
jgi:hypothetical protein